MMSTLEEVLFSEGTILKIQDKLFFKLNEKRSVLRSFSYRFLKAELIAARR